MEIKISSLDPTGISDEIFSTELPIKYFRFLVEIDGVQYMLTKFDAQLVGGGNDIFDELYNNYKNTYFNKWDEDEYLSTLPKGGRILNKDEFVTRLMIDETFNKEWGNPINYNN